MSETQTLTAARTPTVYFIDDSATMREVIKVAFRKENIHVITCPDAATALAQFGETAPDAVITDVIMPDKDGYEVCEFIKQHEQFGKTPVILMSGVVNRSVAEKAMAVKADELIRKPFQPHDLIVRVKTLLFPKISGESLSKSSAFSPAPASDRSASQILSNLFSAGSSRAADSFQQNPRPEVPIAVEHPRSSVPSRPAGPAHFPAQPVAAETAAEVHKLRNEIRRLELLVTKLRAELEAEHQYCTALEAQFKTIQDSE